MRRDQLEPKDHAMHALRNRALRRMLDTVLLTQKTKRHAERTRVLTAQARRSRWDRMSADAVQPAPRRARPALRLVKS